VVVTAALLAVAPKVDIEDRASFHLKPEDDEGTVLFLLPIVWNGYRIFRNLLKYHPILDPGFAAAYKSSL